MRARDIIAEVAAAHQLRIADLVGPSHSRRIVQARHEAIWRCRQVMTDEGKNRFSLPFLGRMFNRDHTSIHYAARKYETGIGKVRAPREDDPCIEARLESLARRQAHMSEDRPNTELYTANMVYSQRQPTRFVA